MSTSVHPTRQQLDELDALLQRMLALPVNSPEEEVAPAGAREPERGPTESPRPRQAENDRPKSRVPPLPARPAAQAPPVSAGPEADQEAWVPLRSSWQPSAQTWGPLAKQWQEAQQASQAQPATRKQRAEPADEEPVDEQTVLSTESAPPDLNEGASGNESSEANARATPPALPTSWQVDARANEPLEPLPSLKGLLPRPQAPAADLPVEATPSAEPLRPLLWPLAAVATAFDGCLALLGPLGKPLRAPAGKTFLGVVGLLCLAGAAVLSTLDWFGWTW
jgi:hypothetical protein